MKTFCNLVQASLARADAHGRILTLHGHRKSADLAEEKSHESRKLSFQRPNFNCRGSLLILPYINISQIDTVLQKKKRKMKYVSHHSQVCEISLLRIINA